MEVVKHYFNDNWNIQDIFNLIDSSLLTKTGLKGKEGLSIPYYELERYRQSLVLFLFNKMLEITKSNISQKRGYEGHIKFYKSLAENELSSKRDFMNLHKREVFVASYSFINFNWDLYSILPIIEAHGQINKENNFYFPNGRNPQLRIFTDFSCEYASKQKNGELWYPFTEPAAFITNQEKYDTTRRVILVKCLSPHGSMNLFKCPNCAKHSYYLGDLSVKSLAENLNYDGEEFSLYSCPYCNTGISCWNVDALHQSNFKTRNAFLEELRISMITELRKAKRLVFIGYSMPSDDVDYLTIFKSLSNSIEEVYVVLKSDKGNNYFVAYEDLDKEEQEKVKTFRTVFKGKLVYYNMAGFPDSVDEILRVVSTDT